MKTRVATCQNKTKFDEVENAERVASHMTGKYGEEFMAYRCEHGTHFHIGHKTPLRFAIAAECMAIFNRGIQAGQTGDPKGLSVTKAKEYADKIIALSYVGRVTIEDVKLPRLF